VTSNNINVAFGEGSTPEAVQEAVEEHIKSRPRGLFLPKRIEVEDFFSNLAEEIKRAGGTP
jgi:hypothetical protein